MNLLSQKAKTGSSTLDWDIICWNTWIKQWRNKLCKHFCSRWCSLCGYTILLHYFDKIWNRCNALNRLLGPCHSQNPVESSKLERRTRFTYCFTEFLSSHANVRHTHSVFWQETWKLVCRRFCLTQNLTFHRSCPILDVYLSPVLHIRTRLPIIIFVVKHWKNLRCKKFKSKKHSEILERI